MQKKGSSAIVISIVLVIVAMVIGLVVGILIGRNNGTGNTQETNPVVETRPVIETANETEVPVAETLAPDDSVAVVHVGDSIVTMNEINARLYTLRNYYIETYGEEPWGQEIDGQMLSDIAKNQLNDDIIRAEVCMDKAAEYGVVVTADVTNLCREEANNFISNIGEEIAAEFGLTWAALENVYVKYEVITQVNNALNDQVKAELLQDTANQELSDSELDVMVSEQVQQIIDQWVMDAEVTYEDVWEQIIVGSVG